MTAKKVVRFAGAVALIASSLGAMSLAFAKQPLDGFEAHPPIHVKGEGKLPSQIGTPHGLSPANVRSAYNLPSGGGTGTIAIIDAFDAPNIQNDLNTFSAQYGLPTCTTTACFEKHEMAPRLKSDSGWALEASLDTQWAHAIAPGAKILLVEARSANGSDLLAAVDYARTQPGVVAVSMSWGGNEFAGESSSDSHFTSTSGIVFFASSGDSGAGVQWPAVSANVVGVGGTTLSLSNGVVVSETAWSGSGGGVSKYEAQPGYQAAYGVPQANGFRAVPDVSYNADPNTGVSVYDSTSYQGTRGWFVIGGTSAGAPQWAAVKALGTTASNANLYQDAATANYGTYFRDITSGTNGTCGFYCTAQPTYDYVTGLGSPLTVNF